MTAPYTVQLKLGAYSWTIAQGDLPDPDAVVVLDGAVLSWRYEGDDFPGAQIEPMTASVGLACSNVALMSSLSQGDLASVRLLDDNGECFGAVYGKVAELTADQVMRRGEIWTRYAVTIVDHTAATEPITASLAAQVPDDRYEAIRTAADTPMRVPGVESAPAVQTLAAQDLQETALVDVLKAHARDTLSSEGRYMFFGGLDQFYLVLPVVDAATGALALVSMLYLDEFPDFNTLPATLGLVDHELRIVARTVFGTRYPTAIPGDRVELSSGQWRQGQESTADSVTVRKPDGTAVTRYAEGVTKTTFTNRRTIETQLTQDSWARNLGDAYLPDAPIIRGWDRDGFVWRVEDPVELGGDAEVFFPDLTSARYSTNEVQFPEPAPVCFTGQFAVLDLTDRGNLAGAANHYGGRLRSVTLTIQGGDLVVSFSIRRQLRRAINSAPTLLYASPAWLRATYPNVRLRSGGVDLVDPGITVRDLRLVRQ